MTVLVRPVPKRVASNGIRPFRPNIPANNIRPYTVKTWRPPVPEPLPPAPLLGPKELLALGALVLGQIWGWLASRPATSSPGGGLADAAISGTMPAPGNTAPGAFTIDRIGGTNVYFTAEDCSSTVTEGSGNFRVVNATDVTKVEFMPESGTCGQRSLRWRLTFEGGSSRFETPMSTTYGFKSIGAKHVMTWAGPGAVQWQPPTETLPLPDGYQAPKVKPGIETKPKPLPPIPLPGIPAPAPQPELEPERSPVPVQPGPARPPVTVPAPPNTAPKAPPVPARVIVVRPDGKLPAPAKDPVAVTHPDAHFPIPGGGPIVGNGPQAKPEEIAKELGRLEQKLNGILNPTPDTPIEWQNLLKQLWDMFQNLKDAKTYTITEKCPPCDGGQYDPPTVEVTAPGATDGLGVIANRIDAIAALLDGQLGLKQQICPPCKPKVRGELVTVNFQSHPDEVPNRNRVRKLLRYHDLSNRPEDFHISHWAGYSWKTGGQIVTSKGLDWGIVSCWAIDANEGKRVIAHAAAAAGVNINDPRHTWVLSSTDDPRYGRECTVSPCVYGPTGKLMISKRNGSDGLPSWKRDT